MPARLPASMLPSTNDLATMFCRECENGITVDDRDRELLCIWEEKVRPQVLRQTAAPTAKPHRWPLPDERDSITARFEIPATNCSDEFVGYVTMGMYDDWSLGEVFLSIAKEGSFVSGIMDAFATAVSIGLQHGIPLSTFADKFKFVGFEPSGRVVGAPRAIRSTFFKSILDYLFQYLEHKFPDGALRAEERTAPLAPIRAKKAANEAKPIATNTADTVNAQLQAEASTDT